MARSKDVRTPLGRFAFTDGLFKIQTNEKGRKSWGFTMLFKKGSDMSVLEEAALEAAKEEWGDKAPKWIEDGTIKSPFLDGDGKQGKSKKTGEAHAGFPGHKFIRPVSGEEYKPLVVDKKRQPIVERSKCPSGYYGYAVVNAFTWDNTSQGKGISFGVSMVQVAEEGESLGGSGSANPEDFFESIPDEKDDKAAETKGKGAAGLFG